MSPSSLCCFRTPLYTSALPDLEHGRGSSAQLTGPPRRASEPARLVVAHPAPSTRGTNASSISSQRSQKTVRLAVQKDHSEGRERMPSIDAKRSSSQSKGCDGVSLRRSMSADHCWRLERQSSGTSIVSGDSATSMPMPARSKGSDAHVARRYCSRFSRASASCRRSARTCSRPLMHPKVREMAEQFFENMRNADPAEKLTNALTLTRRSFQGNAWSLVRLGIAIWCCNVGYHVIYSWLLADQARFGGWAWALCIPNGIFYAIMAIVLATAISSITSMGYTVNVQAEHVQMVFNKVIDMETTFWEQSEAISQHLAQLERLVSKLENPHQSSPRSRSQSAEVRTQTIQKLEQKLEKLLQGGTDTDGNSAVVSEVRSILEELHSWTDDARESPDITRDGSFTTVDEVSNEAQDSPKTSSQPSPKLQNSKQPVVTETKPTGLPSGWRTAQDENGYWYYYHKVLRQPQWKRPESDVTTDLGSQSNV
ncbi:hypothetical protein AB1Y20_018179 [Prymnesium parvum]|uniref:WW domain-containing protein n=1 Tax=Prymnesium parvum TaxID=97485 RepID=A0AB34JPX5_PRYPA